MVARFLDAGFKTPKQETKLDRSFVLHPPTLDNAIEVLRESKAEGIVHGDTKNGEIDIEFKTMFDAAKFASVARENGWHFELRHDLAPTTSFWAPAVVTVDPFIYVELKDGTVLQLQYAPHTARWVVWAPDETTRIGSLDPVEAGPHTWHVHRHVGGSNRYIGTYASVADAVHELWYLWQRS